MSVIYRKKVGLALGSGGWRGLAHLGVIKVLEENNIPIDYICGSSIGALMGGMYAYFGNVDKIIEIVNGIGYRDLLTVLSDPFSRLGLIKGKKIIDYLDGLVKKAKIEDLKIPFIATAVDIVSGETIYLDKGSLASAMRASISIPLVFAPVEMEGRKLMDGGNSTPVPTRRVRMMGADVVIGVNLYGNMFPLGEEYIASEDEKHVKKLGPKEILELSYRIMINELAKHNLNEADIALNPRVSERGLDLLLISYRTGDAFEKGKEAMVEKIEALKKLLG